METFIDTALNGIDGPNETYFFIWDHYVIYNLDSDRVVDGVRPIIEWGFPLLFLSQGASVTLDTCIKGRGLFADKAYFLKRISI
jgi:hypothetical protein